MVGLQEYISEFFLFLPRLFVALIVLFFGLLAAIFPVPTLLPAASNVNFPVVAPVEHFDAEIIISIFALSMVFEVFHQNKKSHGFGTESGNAQPSNCVRHRRQGSGAGVPRRGGRVREEGGEGG